MKKVLFGFILYTLTAVFTYAQDITYSSPNIVGSTTVPVGGTLSVSTEVENIGTSTAGNSKVRFYFSTDNVFDVSDNYLGVYSINENLSPQESVGAYYNGSIPNGISPGNYFIIIRTDADDDVAETNEGNNNAAVAITVVASKPDLYRKSIWFPGTPNAGQNLQININVGNQGTEDTSPALVKFYLSDNNTLSTDDLLLGQGTVGDVAAADRRLLIKNVTLPLNEDGNMFVIFEIDANNTEDELNESNNIGAKAITIAPALPDLVVSSFSAPATIIKDNTLSFPVSATVQNQDLQVAGSSTLKYWLSTNTTVDASDIELASVPVPSLVGGATFPDSRTLSIAASTPPGNYYILFEADANNEVTNERSESNNVQSSAFEVRILMADLVVESVSAPSSVILDGAQTFNVSATIRNQGDKVAGSSTLKVWLSSDTQLDTDDDELTSLGVSSINVNSTRQPSSNVSISGNTTPGTYYLLFEADANNAVPERNEDNNINSIEVSIQAPSIDLTLNSIDFSNTLPSDNSLPAVDEGTAFTVVLDIANEGNTNVGVFTVNIYLSSNDTRGDNDVLIGSNTFNSLNAGDEETEEFSANIPADIVSANTDRYVIAIVDESDVIEEGENEGNNTITGQIRVLNRPPSGSAGGGPGGGGGGQQLVRQAGPGLEQASLQASTFSLSTYPNPAQGSTTVSLGAVGNYNVQLVDAQGRQVLQRQVQNANSTNLDLTGLQKGIYLLKAQGAAGIKTQRLVVQ